jgi:hypothetical protein
LSRAYERWSRDHGEGYTCILEFSRGLSHGGYQEAYAHLAEDLLAKAATMYIRVSFEESLRKNRRRYNPDRPDSVLEHGLEDEKMRRLYRHDDWISFSAEDPHYLSVGNLKVPYAVLENEDDVTTAGGDALADRLEAVLSTLWSHWSALHEVENP